MATFINFHLFEVFVKVTDHLMFCLSNKAQAPLVTGQSCRSTHHERGSVPERVHNTLVTV